METNPETTLVEFIRYNNWANAQILAACQVLTSEQLASSAPGSYGTIRATLQHIILAEAYYIGLLTGSRPQPLFKWDDQPNLAEVSTFANQVAGALLDTIKRIPPTHIVHEQEDGNTFDYQALAIFIQVVNHGIEHRTNITTILSSLGLPVPEVDGWGYLSALPDRFEMQEGES
ncbi:MAG: DinB family protein [Anaerolineales bacterium]|nr:DinB family protein [Anaerolineales bacterium]